LPEKKLLPKFVNHGQKGFIALAPGEAKGVTDCVVVAKFSLIDSVETIYRDLSSKFSS
jgi:hypothetical protein